MQFSLQKIIGWLLLLGGLAIIFWTIYSSFNIFTGQVPAPEIFKVEKKEAALPQKGATQNLEDFTNLENIKNQIGKLIEEKLSGTFSLDFLPKILNLFSWTVFAGILIFAGSKISGLGTKLIKKQ
jgi:hypothetical protein